ncbi:hypothetical protein HWC80_gp103 [Mycobacterium phage Indlulamithi]|uniref:Uncharacterized protein n=1 Tax=Mycobacterium phage Indlulamithi TaxID=2656582 RepID=A0A649VDB8_9CAUD|nr:hypothetical protein HWC80_gp103 [Mycobacterium phage Indlulamithi]QGJ90109.1 hypothetical protein PBI_INDLULAMITHI_71 [Mycobacterium phage Indlulamithi]
MPHIQIEVNYPVDLKHYPGIESATEAMLFDCRQIESGDGDIGLLIENDLKIVGVVDDEGNLHEL